MSVSHGITPPTSAVITKTSPHTSLSLVNHASQTLTHSGSGDGSARSATLDSAQSLLRDMRNESGSDKGGGSKKGVFQWKRNREGRQGSSRETRTSSSSSEVGEARSNSTHYGKHYARMGLLMDSPTKETTPTPTWTRVASNSVDVLSRGVTSDSVFEVVRLGGENDMQASPPISVKSESLQGGGIRGEEGPTSSPDSGYGNTPDNPGGAGVGSGPGEEERLSGTRAASIGPARARSGAINENKRSDTQDSAYGTEPSRGTTPTTSLLMPLVDEVDSGHVSTSLLSSDSREMERQFQQGLFSHTHHHSVSSPPSTLSPPIINPQPPRLQHTSPQSKRRRVRTASSKHLSKSTGTQYVLVPLVWEGPEWNVSHLARYLL